MINSITISIVELNSLFFYKFRYYKCPNFTFFKPYGDLVYFSLYIGTMSTDNRTKINQLLQSQPYGAVFASSWLTSQGYSPELQKRYKNSNWLVSIGTGAMKRNGDEVRIDGGLYALQEQLKLSVHIGGTSALSRLGRSQYLELDSNQIHLFGSAEENLPKWFREYEWGLLVNYHASSFLPPALGMTELTSGNLSLMVSSPIRAILECLYLAPSEMSYIECYELLEGMSNVRPATVQQLLEVCTSVKVKRMFLFLAEKAGHSWMKHLVKEKISLGTGKRSLVKAGVYVPAYQITVPKELMDNGTDL